MARNLGPSKSHVKHPHETRQLCADCNANGAEWASINRGVLVCTDCCSVHRSLGRHVSEIKFIHDKDWHPHTWNLVSLLSSGGANGVWEHTLLDPTNSKNIKKKPLPSDPVHPVKADFVRAKHQMLSYVLHPPSPSPPHPTTCLPPVLGEEEPRDGGASAGLQDEEADALSQELHSSVRTANLETSLRLLAQGADPNYFHKGRGNYPLHVAATSGQAEQVELLLVYGATPQNLDTAHLTPAQAARNAGYSDIALRLTDYELELVRRLLCYLNDQQTQCPPHTQPYRSARSFGGEGSDASRGGLFHVPRQLTLPHQHATDAARQAREKLIKLPILLLEELAADLYDEVDRRELDQVWSRKRESLGSTGDRCDVPFLPVNPLLSSTRNQARQKLARLQEGELCSLIVDLLVDAERRATILTSGRGAAAVPPRYAAPTVGDSDLQLPTKDVGQNSPTCKAEYPISSTPFSGSSRPLPADFPFSSTDRPLPSSPTDTPSFASHSPDVPSPVSPQPPPSFFLHSGLRFHSSATLSADDTDSSRTSADRSSFIAAASPASHQPALFPSPSSPSDSASARDVPPVFSLNLDSSTNLCLGPANAKLCLDDGQPQCPGKSTAGEACPAGQRFPKNVLTCDQLVSEASSFVNMMSSRDKMKLSRQDGMKKDSPSFLNNDSVQSSREFQSKVNNCVRESTFSEDSLQFDSNSNNKTRLYLPLKSVTDKTNDDIERASFSSPHAVFGGNTQQDQPTSFFLRQRSGSEGIYPPLSPESTVDSGSCTYAPLGSVASGINPPLSPCQPTLGYHIPARRVPSGINPPLSPQAPNMDTASETYMQLGSIRSGINPPLSPQASTFDTASETYAQLGSVRSGINPPLSREASTVDTISDNYAQLGSIGSGIHPSLSVRASNLDSASEAYVNLGSIYSGIHPALTPAASSVGARAPFDQYSSVQMAFGRNNQNNPLYQSYDTVHVSSDEASEVELETKSLDEGRVADTEDNTEVNMTEDEKLNRKITAEEKTSEKPSGKKVNDSGKSVRRRIRESFQRVTNNNKSDDIKRSNRSDKYSSGFSSESNMSSEGESQYTISSRSEAVKTPLSTRSSTGLFAAQISRSFRQKFMSKSKDVKKESNSVLKHSEAIEKSRSLPLSETNSVVDGVGKRASAGPDDKVRSSESRSKFVRTLTMPLKLASQRRPSLSRGISRSQPTTPEMARKHRVVQSYTRQRTSTNVFGHSSYLSPQLRIRDPLNVNSPQPASSMRSLFSGKEKNTIKHISKPIMVTDPLNFQRLTTSTKSLMTHRDKNYMRPLVKSYGSDGKPPIASKPAPHHFSENLHRIRVSNSGDFSSSSYEPAALVSSCRTSELYSGWDELFLEVCNKCRQNVSDGIQHPSIWGFNEYLPSGYVRSPEEIKILVAAAAKKKNAKEDCKLQ